MARERAAGQDKKALREAELERLAPSRATLAATRTRGSSVVLVDYIVGEGDTLEGIAMSRGVTPAWLKRKNGGSRFDPVVGDHMHVPKSMEGGATTKEEEKKEDTTSTGPSAHSEASTGPSTHSEVNHESRETETPLESQPEEEEEKPEEAEEAEAEEEAGEAGGGGGHGASCLPADCTSFGNQDLDPDLLFPDPSVSPDEALFHDMGLVT